MRIPSGKTDQVIYFIGVDPTDLKTRETGLSSFTVYRSRNGGAATAYTTPTVSELSAANMPGLYSLLIDEDTTIASSSDSEEYAVHITQASMAPVTRTFELYRPKVTAGETLTVASGVGSVLVTSMANSTLVASAIASSAITSAKFAAGAIDASAIAADAIGASELAADAASEIAAAVWDLDATAHQTQGTFGQAIGDPGADTDTIWALTNTNLDAAVSSRLASASYAIPLDAAGTRAAVGLASANLDTQLDALPTAAENAAAVLTTAMTETYSTDGNAVTAAQALYELLAYDQESAISGTTMTIKKRDGVTTAMTVTLDDATTPTAKTRSG